MFLSNFSHSDAMACVLIFIRVLSVLLTLPKLATDRYFFMFRVLFAFAMALVIAPLVCAGDHAVSINNVYDFSSQIIGETGIGIALGLAASCTIIGLVSAGQIISQLLGFQIGSLQQGLNLEQSTDYRKLFFAIGMFLWFSVSGHRVAIEGLIRSFEYFPVGDAHFSMELLALVNQLIGASLEFAIRFSLPVVIASVIGFIVAGFFGRILGPGQSTSVAFGINHSLFFLVAIPLIVVISNESYSQTTSQIETLIDSLTHIRFR